MAGNIVVVAAETSGGVGEGCGCVGVWVKSLWFISIATGTSELSSSSISKLSVSLNNSSLGSNKAKGSSHSSVVTPAEEVSPTKMKTETVNKITTCKKLEMKII